MSGNVCPHCGAQRKSAKLGVTLNGNIIDNGDLSIPLTRYQSRVMAALMERWPYSIGKYQLVEKVWDVHDEPETSGTIIESHVCKLRAKLRPLGLSIVNSRYEGYHLERA